MFYKDEVVKMMTDYINKMNKEIMEKMGALDSLVEQSINEMQPELNKVNGELYDMLKENGVIA